MAGACCVIVSLPVCKCAMAICQAMGPGSATFAEDPDCISSGVSRQHCHSQKLLEPANYFASLLWQDMLPACLVLLQGAWSLSKAALMHDICNNSATNASPPISFLIDGLWCCGVLQWWYLCFMEPPEGHLIHAWKKFLSAVERSFFGDCLGPFPWIANISWPAAACGWSSVLASSTRDVE